MHDSKSSLCEAQFVQNVWIESYDPTIEDSYRKAIDVDVSSPQGSGRVSTNVSQGRHVILEILDTAGTEQFSRFSCACIGRLLTSR